MNKLMFFLWAWALLSTNPNPNTTAISRASCIIIIGPSPRLIYQVNSLDYEFVKSAYMLIVDSVLFYFYLFF